MDKIISSVHGLILDHLPLRTTRSPKGWITFDCPICNDNRKRGGVIVSGAKISYHCFNCDFRTGWTPTPHLGKRYTQLAAALGAEANEINQVKLELLKYTDEFESEDNDYNDYAYNYAKFEPKELPDNAISIEDLDDDHELVVYAKERGIYGLYPLYHFPDFLNKRRLIFPFIYDHNIVGWTGRHIAPPDKNTPKYLHENMPPAFVFNMDKFVDSQREVVVIVEGVIDAIAIDGIAVLGNTITPEQATLISKLGKRVILCPDRDDAGHELIEQALALDWEISFPIWEKDCKDAAEAALRYGRVATLASIIKYATKNKIKTKVKMRIQ